MSVLFIALPIALILGAAAMTACVYCIRAGQYDDLDTPAVRILVDDAPAGEEETNETSAVRIRPQDSKSDLPAGGSICAALEADGEPPSTGQP